jgi:hypothetical protein
MPMPMNALAAGAMPNTGADAGPIAGQGPKVDATAMQTPPAGPQPDAGGASPPPDAGGGPPGAPDVDEAIRKTVAVDAKLRSVLSKDGPIKRKDVIKIATELVAARVISAQSMAQYLSDLPEDPQDIREWVQKHATQADNNLNQLLVMLHRSGEPQDDQGGEQPPPQMPPQQGAIG